MGLDVSEELNMEIERLCRKNLDKYSQPASIDYVTKLPETLLGKISRNELRKGNVTSNNLTRKLRRK